MSEASDQAELPIRRVLARVDLQALLVNSAGCIVYANPRAQALLDAPDASLESLVLDSLFSPRNPDWLSLEIRKTAVSGGWSGTVVMRRFGGSDCWVHMQACRAPLTEPSDDLILLLIEDVTEQMEIAERLMLRTEELYDRNWELEIIGRLSKLVLANSDLETRLAAVLREAAKCTNADGGVVLIKARDSEELVCRCTYGIIPSLLVNTLSLAPKEDPFAVKIMLAERAQVISEEQNISEKLQALTYQYGIETALSVPLLVKGENIGALVVVDTRAERTFSEDEIALAQIITNQAASAIHSALLSEDVEMSRAHWQRTFDAIADPVAVVDLSGRVVKANEALAGHCGIRVESLLGMRCLQIMPWISVEQLNAVAQSGTPEHLGEMDAGGEVWDVNLYPLTGWAGRIDAVVVCAKVTTTEHRLREELCRASRLALVGELLAGTAHSMGNVLMAIQGTLESAARGIEEAESSEQSISSLNQAIEHIGRGSEMIYRLLNFSRGAGGIMGRSSLRQSAEAALALCRTHPSSKQRTIENIIPPDLPMVEGQSGALQEVILNLMLNALQATDPGGRVSLNAQIVGDCVNLLITDNGCGMEPEVASRVFEPFFSTKGGTGLGLSASAAVIQHIGGSISVESTPRQGTTFTIRLNLAGFNALGQGRSAAWSSGAKPMK